MEHFPILTVLMLIPLIGASLVAGVSPSRKELARGLALGFSLLSLSVALALALAFDPANPNLQFKEQHRWIPSIHVDYYLGLDGLGLLMVLLTALVTPFALLASWRLEEKVPLYFALALFLQAGLYGAFTALNFFHWFIFWELTLIPAFFLVKLWGGKERGPAAWQFFVYTMAGSIAMLLGFLALYRVTGTFNFDELAALGRSGGLEALFAARWQGLGLSGSEALLLLFCLVLLGFAVKVPLMPFHTWLPATYAEAPTGTTMLLTGVLSKLGVYGFLRLLLPVFPMQAKALAEPLLALAVLTIVASACAALAQQDLKRTLAYSSVNHLGYCLLGLFAVVRYQPAPGPWPHEQTAALNGVLLQMFNHGVTAAALFCGLGFLEQRAGGRRGLDDFGGLRSKMPVFTGLLGICLMASLGLPGLSGFVGEFLIFKGVFALAPWAAAIAALGLLVTAIFVLNILQRVFSGPLNSRWSDLPDLTVSERLMLAPAIGLIFLLGVWPAPVINLVNATAMKLAAQLGF